MDDIFEPGHQRSACGLRISFDSLSSHVQVRPQVGVAGTVHRMAGKADALERRKAAHDRAVGRLAFGRADGREALGGRAAQVDARDRPRPQAFGDAHRHVGLVCLFRGFGHGPDQPERADILPFQPGPRLGGILHGQPGARAVGAVCQQQAQRQMRNVAIGGCRGGAAVRRGGQPRQQRSHRNGLERHAALVVVVVDGDADQAPVFQQRISGQGLLLRARRDGQRGRRVHGLCRRGADQRQRAADGGGGL
jgi:hypothetical protein